VIDKCFIFSQAIQNLKYLYVVFLLRNKIGTTCGLVHQGQCRNDLHSFFISCDAYNIEGVRICGKSRTETRRLHIRQLLRIVPFFIVGKL
jgi:hypothetical protein